MKEPQAIFQFNRFFVTESSYKFVEEGTYNLSINISPSGLIFADLNQFQLTLETQVIDEAGKFECRVKSVALFDFPNDADIEQLKSTLFINNAPAIVFPYVRAYIANLTAQSGLLNIMLPTLNLSNLGQELKAKIEVK